MLKYLSNIYVLHSSEWETTVVSTTQRMKGLLVAKEIVRIAKLQFNAGQAKPGPELAGLGIVMPDFTRAFNDATKDRGSEPVPVSITVFKDKSFTFKTHTAPASYKLKQAANIKKGSENAKTTKVATVTKDQVREIAEYKMEDLNTTDIEAAIRTIAGTAKNMGILVDGLDNIQAEMAAAKEAAAAEAAAEAKEAELDAAAEAAKEAKDAPIEVNAIAQKAEESEEGGE